MGREFENLKCVLLCYHSSPTQDSPGVSRPHQALVFVVCILSQCIRFDDTFMSSVSDRRPWSVPNSEQTVLRLI